MMYQHNLTFKMKAKRFLKECWRVLKITKKPDKNEFKTVVKVTSLGMLVIGFIGFIITMITQFIR